MRKLAVWVFAATQSRPHADLLANNLQEPGFIKVLSSRTECSRLSLDLGMSSRIRVLTRTLGAVAFASGGRRGRHVRSGISKSAGRWHMLGTRTRCRQDGISCRQNATSLRQSVRDQLFSRMSV